MFSFLVFDKLLDDEAREVVEDSNEVDIRLRWRHGSSANVIVFGFVRISHYAF